VAEGPLFLPLVGTFITAQEARDRVEEVGRWVGVVDLLNLPVHESQFFEDVSF
jgi:hypothetical protein